MSIVNQMRLSKIFQPDPFWSKVGAYKSLIRLEGEGGIGCNNNLRLHPLTDAEILVNSPK